MKLSKVKNLGKELSKKELKSLNGKGTYYYQCADGMTGSIRNIEDGDVVANPCKGHGGIIN
ncbi:hypothetical protein [Tenacibaculum caenipelagi]|uniref:Uncharacterized protein n=1 Tax=Tenacibaculum caenipelagi TaxID=1325435 RepID=A0A4R6TCM5_9FLAO|nr:hypothetical protein [Tenacibaculum caenipelagi]TDQ25534.1 hypothetical protein DFQ07_1957 [Tenacibaculum caenipelagi]